MWTHDCPEHYPDSDYGRPSAKQIIYAEEARRHLKNLKATLERLTVPQQRAILATIRDELVGRTFQRDSSHASKGRVQC